MTKLLATRGLDLRVKLWVEAMKQAAIGPLLIATEAVDVVDNYHLFVEQTGEENPNAWLTHVDRRCRPSVRGTNQEQRSPGH